MWQQFVRGKGKKMICNNCGAEIEEGMKFCGECGEAVPQVKICVSCGAEIAIRMKFCPECGTNQNTGAKAGKTSTIKAGMSLGDKNVIGGSVIGKKEETVISGNATIVKTEDQTKLVKQCHICGSNVSILNGFDCPECGQFTCQNCYDEEEGCCVECAEDKKEQKFDRYKEAVNQYLADGRIDQTDRKKLNSLQKELGLSSEKAKQLEEEIKNRYYKGIEFTSIEKRKIEKAKTIFYNEGNTEEALQLLEPIYQTHKNEESVLEIYLPVLADVEPEKALNIVKELQIDVLMGYVISIGINIRQNNLIEAERLCNKALGMWNKNVILKCFNIFIKLAVYKQEKDVYFLEEAKSLAEQLGKAKTELELSYQVKVQDLLKEEAGEKITEYDRETCEKNGLCYYVMAGNPLLKMDDFEKRKSIKLLQSRILENEKDYDLEQIKEVEAVFHNPEIQFIICERYRKKEDYINSFYWAEKSAEQNYADGIAILGWHYVYGKGCQEDFNKGYDLIKQAVSMNSLYGMNNLGDMYYYGRGVKEDYAEAVKWYRKSAEQGNADAQYYLGHMYQKGEGVKQDYAEAVKWYKKSAEQGNTVGQYYLGRMYQNGYGVKQDYKEAVKWLTKAATQGSIDAQNTLDYIKKQNNAKPNFKDCEIHDNSNNDIESELCDTGDIFKQMDDFSIADAIVSLFTKEK